MGKAFIIVLILFASSSYAQQLSNISINSIASNMQGGDISLSFSVGDLVVEQFETDNIVLGGGFYPIINVVTSDAPENAINLLVFPNPANDVLYLQIKGGYGYSYKVDLVNLNGQVQSFWLINESTPLSLLNCPDGIYLLKVQSPIGKILFTRKIIKRK